MLTARISLPKGFLPAEAYILGLNHEFHAVTNLGSLDFFHPEEQHRLHRYGPLDDVELPAWALRNLLRIALRHQFAIVCVQFLTCSMLAFATLQCGAHVSVTLETF